MTTRKLIWQGVAAAFRFLGHAWKRAWVEMTVAAGIFGSVWGAGLLSRASPWRALALIAILATALGLQSSLYRLALGGGQFPPTGRGVGRVAARMLIVWLLSFAFLGILGLLAFVVVLSFAYGVASAGHGFVTGLPTTWAGAIDDRGRGVLLVVGGLVFSGLLWAATRISFAGAATVAEGKVQVLASWPATRGLVWAILIGRLALAVAPAVFAFLVLHAAGQVFGAAPAAVWGAGLLAGVTLAGVWLPGNVGLMAYLYRQSPTV